MDDRLQRDMQRAMIGGVCAGFAKRYDFDLSLLRVVAVLCAVATGGVFIALYVVAWIVMPRADAAALPAMPVTEGAPPMPAAPLVPPSVADEMRNVSDRLVEAARVLAEHTRVAAEEIAEIARRGATPPAPAAHHGDPGVPPEAPDLPPTPGIPPTDVPVPPEPTAHGGTAFVPQGTPTSDTAGTSSEFSTSAAPSAPSPAPVQPSPPPPAS